MSHFHCRIELHRRNGASMCALALLLGSAASAAATTPVAEAHLIAAYDLGRRGAVYSAQAEFIQVLRSVAQEGGTQAGAVDRSNALKAGLLAFAEAEDFSAGGSPRDGDVDIGRRIATHCTPILHGADVEKLTPLAALQTYYTYAKQQLATAGGRDRAASTALYGLAKLQPFLGAGNAAPKAVTLLQAALMVDPGNYYAANELGVLLFRHGQAEEARLLLIHSLRLTPRSETWHNIAVVCRAVGRVEEATGAVKNCQAAFIAERSSAQSHRAGGGLVYWVNKEKLLNAPADASWDAAPSGASRGPARTASLAQTEVDAKSDLSLSSLPPWNSKESK